MKNEGKKFEERGRKAGENCREGMRNGKKMEIELKSS